jgi:hypothetical protein
MKRPGGITRLGLGLWLATACAPGAGIPATAPPPAVPMTAPSPLEELLEGHAFTPADLLVADDVSLEPPHELSAGAARRDVALLLYALRNGYGGHRFIARRRIAAAEQNLADLVADESAQGPRAFCDAVAEVLATLPDQHLEAKLAGERCGPPPNGRAPDGAVGRNFAPPFPRQAARPWATETRKLANGTVGLIAITRFPLADDPVWEGFLDAVAALASADALVIDMRGNSGGDDTTAYRLAQVLGGRFVRRTGVEKIRSQRPATWALRINHLTLELVSHAARGEPAPLHIQKHRDEFTAEYRRALRGESEPEVVETPGPDRGLEGEFTPFTRPIYVLVDRRCGSSCESGMEVLAQLTNATTVGENTAGTIHFGNIGKLVMPASAIVVQIASQFTRYANGTFVEGAGFAPDVAVPPGADALDVTLERWSSGQKDAVDLER